MPYFDNASTTLVKPESVARAVHHALASNTIGNAGRSGHRYALNALTELFSARQAIADLFSVKNPLTVAFTYNATFSLNLVLSALFKESDHIITTVTEHNSVLRPLYALQKKGVWLSFIGIDRQIGQLQYDEFEHNLTQKTRAVVINHCSNITGAVVDIQRVAEFCKKHHLWLIIDAAQSAGTVELNARHLDNSIICFTGHKGLYGPQGTGGMIVQGDFPFEPIFSGGSGMDSFAKTHPSAMPDLFEYGTMNTHSIAGLTEGVQFVYNTGVSKIHRRLMHLRTRFIEGLRTLPSVCIYGNDDKKTNSAIVSINIENCPSSSIGDFLLERNIATRTGFHCSPLMHQQYGTEKMGMIRFSFSLFNTNQEIDYALEVLREMVL